MNLTKSKRSNWASVTAPLAKALTQQQSHPVAKAAELGQMYRLKSHFYSSAGDLMISYLQFLFQLGKVLF
jgi:hypothetical protein